jgi:hypothetical protein
MTNIFVVALELQKLFESNDWPFCIIGGIAALHWGEPRVTRDVDVTLLTGFGGEEAFIQSLLAKYKGRVSDPTAFALRNRVLLIMAEGGIGIDVALGALPFEEAAVSRSKKVEVAQGIHLKLCTPEDLIVFKSFAARDIDWRDVAGVISRQGSAKLDWKYIDRQLAPLAEAKEQPELIRRLHKLIEQSQ